MSSNRREFLRNAGVAAGAVAVSQLAAGGVLAAHAGGGRRRVLVVVQQSGGNDGLNTVIPMEDDGYHRVRPTLRIAKNAAAKLTASIGLHPRMAKLKGLFDDGKVAVVQGAGYPGPNRSHFRSMEIWHTAEPQETIIRDGWLGRVMAERGGSKPGQTAPAAFIGSELPLALVMPHGQVAVLPNIQSFRPLPDHMAGADQGVRLAAIREAQEARRDTGKNATLAFLQDASLSTLAASRSVQEMARAYDTPIHYAGALGQSLRLVATLISGGADFEVYYVAQGGYDTHANQFGAQANLLGELSENLAAFYQDCKRIGRGNDVVTMTFSEFGRRVEENASRGTDHGTAGPMLLVSGGLKGGLYGQYPSLKDLDHGDLKFTTDFRSVYSAVLGKWLGVDARKVLHGNFAPLPIFG